MTLNLKYNEDDLLLKIFNSRDGFVFRIIYYHYFNEFHLYSSSLYVNGSINLLNIVLDTFMCVWRNKRMVFNVGSKLKSFITIAIKNCYMYAEEIASMLDKNVRPVDNTKQRAIFILKQRLLKDRRFLIFSYFNIV